jgi:hypothetical protein
VQIGSEKRDWDSDHVPLDCEVALPSSALGRAVNYTLALWKKLARFIQYPELELSNNLAENSMRPVSLGRKN